MMSAAGQKIFERQGVKSENFSKKNLEGYCFNECIFESCDFSESDLRKTRFCTCTFVKCNFSLPILEGCRLQEVQFVDCKMVGTDFFKCEKTFFSVKFKNCIIEYCNFSELNMKNTSFSGSKVKEGYFTGTLLSGADFSDVELTGTTFHNCDLCKADFSKAIRYVIDPQTNKIKKAKFSLPEALGLLRAFDITLV